LIIIDKTIANTIRGHVKEPVVGRKMFPSIKNANIQGNAGIRYPTAQSIPSLRKQDSVLGGPKNHKSEVQKHK
jgi:hypothetical protein